MQEVLTERSKGIAFDIESAGEDVQVNVELITSNLLKDFPEILPREWSRVMVCISCELNPSIGGFAVELSRARNDRYFRYAENIRRKHSIGKKWTHSKLDDISKGRDVVLVISPCPQIIPGYNDWRSQYDVGDPSVILAHEFRHAVDMLREDYSENEVIAHAYALAMQNEWRGAVKVSENAWVAD